MVKTRMNKKKIPALKITEIATPLNQERSPIRKLVRKTKREVENRYPIHGMAAEYSRRRAKRSRT